jgi:predicted kinase
METTWKIHTVQNLDELAKQFTWLEEMKSVPQDSKYHAEGDVFTHTKMVVEALVKEPAYQVLDAQAQEILFAVALLHDVEKRSTTEIQTNGSITSHGHARKGAQTARMLLFKHFNCPFFIREQIAGLVRYHGLPLWLLEKPDPLKALLSCALHINTQWLGLFAKADFLGRICNDQHEMLDRIDFFEEYAKENQCYGVPYPFINNLSRFLYFNKDDGHVGYIPFNDREFDVYILSGLPGMGKDTYIQKQTKDLPVISLDDMRRERKISPTDKAGNGQLVQEAKERARVYMRKKQSFIWNATNITRQMRSQLVDFCLPYKARVHIIYIEVPYTQWLVQNKNRAYPLPERVLVNMLHKLEVPQLSEAHEVVYAVGNEKN